MNKNLEAIFDLYNAVSVNIQEGSSLRQRSLFSLKLCLSLRVCVMIGGTGQDLSKPLAVF